MSKIDKVGTSPRHENDNRRMRCGAYTSYSVYENKRVIVCRRQRDRKKCGVCPHRRG